jgi:hypothetical protein
LARDGEPPRAKARAKARREPSSFVPLPPRHDVLSRNTDVPPSKLKFRSVLSMLTFPETAMAPGLLFHVKPCLPDGYKVPEISEISS